jgi:hypothetical protein
MDHSHQVLEALLDNEIVMNTLEKENLKVIQNTPSVGEKLKKTYLLLQRGIKLSHKFDCSALIPALSHELYETAENAARNNMLPLPFSPTFLDFGTCQRGGLANGAVVGTWTLCMLLVESEGEILVELITNVPPPGGYQKRWTVYPIGVSVKLGLESGPMYSIYRHKYFDENIKISNQIIEAQIHNAKIAMQTLVLMETRHIKTDLVLPPKFLNKKRESKGRPQLDEHRIVYIDLSTAERDPADRGPTTHTSPRLHWRRGHVRTWRHYTSRSKPACGAL